MAFVPVPKKGAPKSNQEAEERLVLYWTWNVRLVLANQFMATDATRTEMGAL
jgi:hypothetical protein